MMSLKTKRITLVVVAFLVGIVSSLFIYNQQKKNLNSNIEITFIDSRQAIVFWTTEDETIGFIKYGPSKDSLDQESYQTSSEPGKVHAIVLNDIPLEGVYISLHNESDSPFLFTRTQRIVFDAKTYIE